MRGGRTAELGRRAALAAALALAIASGRAVAEPRRPAEPSAGEAQRVAESELQRRKREARERFARGLELAEAERWDAALAEFVASREIYATRVATRNAAVALAELERFSEALALYEELLREFGAQMGERERGEVVIEMEELRRNVGELAIEGAPPGSIVVIDGEQRGTTPLAPLFVNAGTHTLRVSNESYETYEAEVVIAGRQRKTVVTRLTALRMNVPFVVAAAPPPTSVASGIPLYVEISGGLALASSFGGDAASSCDDEVEIPAELPSGGTGPACSSRARPFGFLGAARVGYRLNFGLGLELFGGYVRAAERVTRRVRAEVDPAMPEPAPFFADRYGDWTRVSGPVAGVSASYLLADAPVRLVARAAFGVLRAHVRHENGGAFSGALDGDVFTREVRVPEQALNAWIPFAGPELRVGYGLSARLALDVGLAALWMFPGSTPRGGRTAQSNEKERNTVIVDENGDDRFFSLPRETSLGRFLLLVPSLGASLTL